MENKTIIVFGFIGLFLIFLIAIFIISIKLGYEPNYLTNIVCKEQPYEDIEYYYEKEPYKDTETYYEREPYTTCAGYSIWTGKCNKWKTEYENVRKTRSVTRYRNVQKSRAITKFQEVCIRIYFWKSVDYSENWLNYPEIYNRQGNRIYKVTA